MHQFKNLSKIGKVRYKAHHLAYNNDELCVNGKTSLNCEGKAVIVDTQQALVLGLNALQELGIVKIVLNVNNPNQCLIQK